MFRCDGAGWLVLSWLPWLPSRRCYLLRYRAFQLEKHPHSSSSCWWVKLQRATENALANKSNQDFSQAGNIRPQEISSETNPIGHKRKNVLYLGVNNAMFTSPTRDGNAILLGHHLQVKVYQLFWNPEYLSGLWKRTFYLLLCSQTLYRLSWSAAVNFKINTGHTERPFNDWG